MHLWMVRRPVLTESKVSLSPRSDVLHRVMSVFNAAPSDGPKVTGIQSCVPALSLAHRHFSRMIFILYLFINRIINLKCSSSSSLLSGYTICVLCPPFWYLLLPSVSWNGTFSQFKHLKCFLCSVMNNTSVAMWIFCFYIHFSEQPNYFVTDQITKSLGSYTSIMLSSCPIEYMWHTNSPETMASCQLLLHWLHCNSPALGMLMSWSLN